MMHIVRKGYVIQLFCLLLLTLGVHTFIDAWTWQLITEIPIMFFHGIINCMSSILFYKVFHFPVLVLWLITGGLFFTLKLRFVNFRMFGHAIAVVRGKYSKDTDPGEVTHMQAFCSAVSATVGLGNIGGVAIAVTLGGPGSVVWMVIAGFFGMSAKFAEVTLGQKYRKFDKNGKVSGGAFHYLKDGLAAKNLPRLGKVLAITFAIFCILGTLGAGNMFQSNQTVTIISNTFSANNDLSRLLLSLGITFLVWVVLIGGVKRIAVVTEAIVPFMAALYIIAGSVIIAVNFENIGSAFTVMFTDAFNGHAVGGGIIGVMVNGFKRAAFSNESGLGSAAIVHSAAKTKEPAREGCVALLEPFVDTVVICFFTGIIITITGVYKDSGSVTGVLLTSKAFATVFDWFPIVLSVAVALFAYSTMITWSYYGERAWQYIFGDKSVKVFYVIFCLFVFLGGMLNDIALIINFSDLLLLSMAIPNLIGMYILSGIVKQELDQYVEKLKNKEFSRT